MFIKKLIRANDVALSIFTISFFVYAIFTGINLSVQILTKMRIADGVESAARYLATHKDNDPATRTQVSNIIQNYANSVFIHNAPVQVGWDTDLTGACANGNVSACSNDLTAGTGLYDYRQQFVIVASIEIPPVIPIPILSSLPTKIYSRGVTEILE